MDCLINYNKLIVFNWKKNLFFFQEVYIVMWHSFYRLWGTERKGEGEGRDTLSW